VQIQDVTGLTRTNVWGNEGNKVVVFLAFFSLGFWPPFFDPPPESAPVLGSPLEAGLTCTNGGTCLGHQQRLPPGEGARWRIQENTSQDKGEGQPRL